MADSEPPICEAFAAVAALCAALGVKDINKLPACWERQVDEQWWIAVNGHRTPQKCSRGAEVSPFDCYVEFNGWPAGTFNPYGGILAAGEGANENTFIAAVIAATERANGRAFLSGETRG